MNGFKKAAVAFVALGLVACASGPQRLEKAEHNQDCGTNEGVTIVSDNEVRVSLGQRPTAGYGIHYRQNNSNGYVSVHYREITPPADQFAAQIITTPCVRLPLSDDWHTLQVVNDDNGQMWEFRSQPVISPKSF